jgi:hypothetical protein
MTRAAALALLVACDLGIGGDPNAGPRSACAPGHARLDPAGGCFTAQAAIAIDGDIADWASIASISLASKCIAPPCEGLAPATLQVAGGTATPMDSDLLVRVSFGAPPPIAAPDLRVVLDVSASPIRPATSGHDRLAALGATLDYEKTGYVITPGVAPYRWAWTADGFEAEIDGTWLTYQGAARIAIAVEHTVAGVWTPVTTTAPIDACWGWRAGSDALPVNACEAQPR